MSGLTRNWTFNGSIYCVLYLHILHFYFVGQICVYVRILVCSVVTHNGVLLEYPTTAGFNGDIQRMARTLTQ